MNIPLPPPKLLGIRTSAWKEIICFFVLLCGGALLWGTPINFFKMCLHPFWIIVLIIAAQYGTVEALLAASISAAILLLGPIPVQTILQDRFEYFFYLIKTPLLWFVAAIFLGELRLKHIRETESLRQIAIQAEEREKKVAEAYNALKKIKELLEIHVATDRQTTLEVIKSFKELEKSNPKEILQGAMDLIKTLVAPEKFSIFLLEKGLLKLILSEGWEEGDPFAKEIEEDSPLFQEIVVNKHMVQINTSDPKILNIQGVLATPILSDEDVVFGMVKVEQIPFLRLRIQEIESLRIIGEWVGTAYSHHLPKKKRNGDGTR
ncbi:MAG: GAF domain-containing protein [Chlamydiae bacterium]|nr:GAF domain-containing protein [Chlamydiota bacterium]